MEIIEDHVIGNKHVKCDSAVTVRGDFTCVFVLSHTCPQSLNSWCCTTRQAWRWAQVPSNQLHQVAVESWDTPKTSSGISESGPVLRHWRTEGQHGGLCTVEDRGHFNVEREREDTWTWRCVRCLPVTENSCEAGPTFLSKYLYVLVHVFVPIAGPSAYMTTHTHTVFSPYLGQGWKTKR